MGHNREIGCASSYSYDLVCSVVERFRARVIRRYTMSALWRHRTKGEVFWVHEFRAIIGRLLNNPKKEQPQFSVHVRSGIVLYWRSCVTSAGELASASKLWLSCRDWLVRTFDSVCSSCFGSCARSAPPGLSACGPAVRTPARGQSQAPE